ncbi:MAG: AGE family epimerase/isomerase [Bryobacterales bacterium]|nr:AGE family epimerase/isomerase [Bryobacterales bacterium]
MSGSNRRRFLTAASAGVAGLATPGRRSAAAVSKRYPQPSDQLSGGNLEQLRDTYRTELFDVQFPFWSDHGIDHRLGGFMTALDYDGTRLSDNKYHWYQGRGIWVYSFLYNHLGGDPRHLDIARKAKEFWLEHARQADGFYAIDLSREGEIVKPFEPGVDGDVYGMFFLAEGLQEYAAAAGDGEAREASIALLKKMFAYVNRPDFKDKYAPHPGARIQGNWMVTLQTVTQMLNRGPDPELESIADFCVDAILHKHHNPEIGLTNEYRNHDFSPIPSERNKSLLGHCCQCLWMVMDEALRRRDQGMFDLAARQVRQHLDIGWDHVYGGLPEWINVGAGGYEWPSMKLAGNRPELRIKGEKFYYKSMWANQEVLVSTLKIYEHSGAEWAAHYFNLAQKVQDEKFSLRRFGYPSYSLGEDRRFSFKPSYHGARQDHYHPLRRLMMNLLALERLSRGQGNDA